MSFGWSAGDVIAGLKAIWDVWEAVSDGPLNAKYQASQFFEEFYHVISRLDDWERRKSECAKDDRLVRSQRDLRDECTLFIKKHFTLIQQINPRTRAVRPGRSTWLQKVAFTRGQVVELYRQVEWPTQRNTVTKLREKLRFFLELAAWDVTIDIHRTVKDIRSVNSELIATNYKLVTSHLDLVASITSNLKRVTNPLEPGRQAQEIDYPMLRQFERALRPPPPIAGLLEDSPSIAEIPPWSARRRNDEAQYATIASSSSQGQDGGAFGEEEVRGLISQRLDNLSMRVKRTETLETISESGSQHTIQPTTQHLLDRLKEIRAQIGDAVGILSHVPPNEMSLVSTDPGVALKKELEAWDTIKGRIEREILHPSPAVRRVWTVDSTTAESEPIPITSSQTPPMAIQQRKTSGSLSPPASYDGWMGPNVSSSRNPGSLSSSPNERRMSVSPKDRRMSSHSRSNSTSSTPRRPSIRSDHEFPIHLYYPQHVVRALIRSISKNDEGDILTISSYSMDGLTRYRHSVDYDNEDLKIETSMTPFVDNHHVVDGSSDQKPKFRVQFKGMHNFEVLIRAENREVRVDAHLCPPMYKFLNEPDFLEFQSLLLHKEIKHHADVLSIKSPAHDVLCRVGTIRILLEPFSKTRHILYFQHMNLSSDQKAGFVELPVSYFKPPNEPTRRAKALTLERLDGKGVSSPKMSVFGMVRQGSVNTIASNETSAAPAFARMGGRGVKGLVVEFYDPAGCHKFWEEFTKIEPIPKPFQQGEGLGLNMGSGFSVQLPGT